ncbi:hypothetical protein B0H67DRAFT_653401 [Lasiosphaeris hirsuta]|uniref:lytic cellulose monooxygenase (C4-dehydrogenating) n=1 Tax=Lasiosphaeris hirsuta TaxID=260670 RepID=A0AA40EAB5_9PEZI|nr:hypothetical protein B0H67DRAFT_653401 [Lasiosphaeris hirsuta]
MKGALGLTALSVAVSQVSAHYIFNQLTVGATKNAVYKYIRQNTNFNQPITELTSNDLRCNLADGGMNTETAAVKPGDSFTFTLDTPVYHQGPVSLYMSKAPGAASDYGGSGGWFKIYDWGMVLCVLDPYKKEKADKARPDIQRWIIKLEYGQ